MVKRLSFAQWTLAYATIYESAGDPIQLAAKLDPMYGTTELPTAPSPGSGAGGPPVPDPVVDEDELCVVCMERPPKIVLPCGHSFCKECISEWFAVYLFFSRCCCGHCSLTVVVVLMICRKGKSDTCPVCRASVTANGADEWVMAGEPSPTELAQFITDFLNNLDEKTLKKAAGYRVIENPNP